MFEPTERPKRGELAVLIHVNFAGKESEEELEEFSELVLSAGASPVEILQTSRRAPDPKYFVGSGKVEEIKAALTYHKADLVIFNHTLSPAQQRNLEKDLQARVLDRIGLILDIFAQRARTFEGKLQVELAQLQHLSTRLIRGWTHLERQKGGIGLRGPGETQLETDRRLIAVRIKALQKRLEKVQGQRELSRRARQRKEFPTVSLVGYTNAGKSTLFNQLTGAQLYVADQLFATLDPTLRKLKVKNFGDIILADTVGFIRHLPHDLVDAFRATLEETKDADLLLHVIDVNDERRDMHVEQVLHVLSQIKAEHVPRILVCNKIDLLDDCEFFAKHDSMKNIKSVYISSKTGQGLELLQQVIAETLARELISVSICLTNEQSKLRSLLYEQGYVVNESHANNGNIQLSICMPRIEYERLFTQGQQE